MVQPPLASNAMLTVMCRVSKLMKGICNPEEVIEEFQDQYVLQQRL